MNGVVRVERGSPSEEELAAVVVALMHIGTATPADPIRHQSRPVRTTRVRAWRCTAGADASPLSAAVLVRLS